MSSNTTVPFQNKKVAVLGFGIEGKSAVHFLTSCGAHITVFDIASEDQFEANEVSKMREKGIVFVFGGMSDLAGFELIVRSPGFSLETEILQRALERKQEITSVTKLFFDLCPCPIIGVTGTKGKGTTSTLIYEMLKAEGKMTYLGGNIGVPALDFLDKLTSESIVVLELSSFQLIDLHKSPHIAVMLMVTSEHLDYHKDINEYVNAKRNIVLHQSESDYAVLNKDYIATRESDIHTNAKVFYVSREIPVDQGVYINDGAVYANVNSTEGKIIDVSEILLPGTHNLENVCAAVTTALLVGVDKKNIVSVLKQFKGLEHRLELVRTVKGVRYYDDSFSTIPETTQAAVEAFKDPEVLILGGSSKNSDFTALGEAIGKAENIKAIIGIGKEWSRIKEQINDWHFQIIEGLNSMEKVVQKAAEITEPGDVVILSPACASFDMFKNYKERGNQFKAAVNSL